MSEERARRTVLVVDGDERVLRPLEIKLARAGFAVHCADDGQEGFEQARADGFEAVVVGDSLGPLDAHSLVRALAGLPGQPVVVALSAVQDEETIARLLRAGCDDYVLKPFSPQEVAHRLRVALLRRQARRETGG